MGDFREFLRRCARHRVAVGLRLGGLADARIAHQAGVSSRRTVGVAENPKEQAKATV